MANVIITDITGILCVYKDTPGIDWAEEITNKQAMEADPLFEKACIAYNSKHDDKYVRGLDVFQGKGSVRDNLVLEERMVESILAGEDFGYGLRFNESAAKAYLKAYFNQNRLLVMSSATCETSRMTLERAIMDYIGNTQEISDPKAQCLPDRFMSNTIICDFTKYGSKKDSGAWEKAIKHYTEKFGKDVRFTFLFEDKYLREASEGIRLAVGYSPAGYNEITTSTLLD